MPTTYAIPNGRTVFDATVYTGTGSTQSVSNQDTGTVGFKPDFVWVKESSQAQDHAWFDSVRGATKQLSCNTSGTEATYANSLSAFNTSGFSVVSDAVVNSSGQSYVGYNWQAGEGTTSTNTNGTLTSTVSVNTTNGFSIVTYTAPASSQVNSVGHGLGVAPAFVIAKNRSSGTGGLGWAIYHKSLGANSYLSFQDPAATTSSGYWGSGMTSSVVGLPTSASSTGYDNCTGNMVAYCWAEVNGYSSFGTYAGNSSTTGPFVYTGFRPRLVMIKKYTNNDAITAYWQEMDTARNSYNVANGAMYALSPSTNYAQYNTGLLMDIFSNGFQIRSNDTYTNKTGESYIYVAFAENPFKYANAR